MPNHRENCREIRTWKKGVKVTLTLDIDTFQYPHRRFLENKDLGQALYEKARKAVLGRRICIDEHMVNSILTHGVGGLFINPERIFVTLTAPTARTSRNCLRRNTALYHAHLSDKAFETIAKSLEDSSATEKRF